MDFLRQYADHDLLIKRPEAVGDITLDEPGRPAPGVGHLAECGVTAPAGTEPVGTAGELRLVVGLQQEAHHFADEFVRPGRRKYSVIPWDGMVKARPC